jgi:hypothetical protein
MIKLKKKDISLDKGKKTKKTQANLLNLGQDLKLIIY